MVWGSVTSLPASPPSEDIERWSRRQKVPDSGNAAQLNPSSLQREGKTRQSGGAEGNACEACPADWGSVRRSASKCHCPLFR